MNATYCLAAATVFVLLAGCSDGNVNEPRGNAIGDRHKDFMRVVEYARKLPNGTHKATTLPPVFQLKNLLRVYVDRGKAYALEFPSEALDSDPVYIYIDGSVPDPESVARALANDNGWRFERKLDEPRWYFAHGQ